MGNSFLRKMMREHRLWTWYFLFLCAVFILTQQPCSAKNVENKSAVSKKELASNAEKKWGILPLSIQLKAAGQLVDFRYLVIDPSKAEAIMKKSDEAYLIDQTSGTRLLVSPTKIGPLRQNGTRPISGKIYPILFTNTENVIKSGSKVTLVIGELQMEDIVVGAATPSQRGTMTTVKRAKWDAVQKLLLKERGMCFEHCGQDRSCIDKCDKAYKSQLDKQYQKLLIEK